MGERRKTRGQEGPSKVPGLSFPLSQPADMADGARDSTFADLDRAVLCFVQQVVTSHSTPVGCAAC